MAVPKLRFKGFEGEWKQVSLSNPEFDIVAGGDVKKASLREYGKYPVIANALTNGGILGYYQDEYRVKAPAVTITGRGEVGVAVARDCNFTPVVRLLSLKSPYNHIFIANAINQRPAVFESTGVPQLTVPKLQSYILPIASLEEQIKIADYFRKLDGMIRAKEAEIATLKQAKAGAMVSMFPQKGETAPRVRFKGFDEPWEIIELAKTAKFSKGFGYSKADLRPDGIPLFLYGRLYTKYNPFIEEIDTYSFEISDMVLSKGGEVVMPSSGETPEDIAVASAILTEGIILSGGLNVIFPNTNIDSSFLALSLTYGDAHYQLAKKAQGKSVVHLYNKDIAELQMLFPSLAEQQKIAAFFRNLDRQIEAQTQILERLKRVKAACLDLMFV